MQSIRRDTRRLPEGFPFDLPLIIELPDLRLESPVTFFVGENGTGKSTLLESIAAAVGSVSVGGHSVDQDPTLEDARALAAYLSCAWRKRTRRGFFMRAEDFFGYARRMQREVEELEEIEDDFEDELSGYALQLAQRAVRGQRGAIEAKYGRKLDARSHGESFLKLFEERFVPGGLYLLDEPETPLSPQRQIAFLSMMKQMVEEQDAQFIIATHSPILMAYPDACILSFDATPLREIAYDDVEHVTVTRDFLNRPGAFLRHL